VSFDAVQQLVSFWFLVSIGALIVGRLIILNSLAKAGQRIDWFWSGTPGYLEKLLWAGRGEAGRTGGMSRFLLGLTLNVIASALAFIFMVVMPAIARRAP